MEPHGILTLYSTKTLEYVIAIAYLIAFVPFWRYVSAPRTAARLVEAARVAGRRTARAAATAGAWFDLPPAFACHPGHVWALKGDDGLVTVGVDDFAAKLLGPLDGLRLPQPGEPVRQGDVAAAARINGEEFGLVSPLSGTVAEVNPAVAASASTATADPYGSGWLFRLKPARYRPEAAHLLTGPLARRWLDAQAESVMRTATPALGAVMQDGGMPVAGFARAAWPEGWQARVRALLLTDEDGDVQTASSDGRIA